VRFFIKFVFCLRQLLLNRTQLSFFFDGVTLRRDCIDKGMKMMWKMKYGAQLSRSVFQNSLHGNDVEAA
jgi:hypothetical protein